jgi:hypothetical protein
MLMDIAIQGFSLACMNRLACTVPASVAAQTLRVDPTSGNILLRDAHCQLLDMHRTDFRRAAFRQRPQPRLMIERAPPKGDHHMLHAGVTAPHPLPSTSCGRLPRWRAGSERWWPARGGYVPMSTARDRSRLCRRSCKAAKRPDC